MPSVRNLLMSRRTSTCFLIVDASIIAPATLRCLPSSMNDWITGAWATSAASPRSESKYVRHSPDTSAGLAR